MKERLLQFIWQFQYYNRTELQTQNGESLQVIFPGQYNTNQGPDFLEAKISINKTILVGHVELHLQSSQWYAHRHDTDSNYRNVILHVVLEDDLPVDEYIPVLVLKDRISRLLLQQYNDWMQQVSFVPCGNSIHTVKPLVWLAWKERMLAERLLRKSAYMLEVLNKNGHHWEQSFWQLIARNFGLRVNAEAFEMMAETIHINILARHKNQQTVIEALLLGQVNLLEGDFADEYPKMLQREYRFYRKKYKLLRTMASVHFLRMRPAAFPTIRISQLAALIHRSAHLFSVMRETDTLKEARSLLSVTANDYWHYHYTFDEPASYKVKNLGHVMINNLMINTIIPSLFAYGHYHQQVLYKNKALSWLEQIKPELNHITSGWEELGLINETAYDSQSFVELKTQYCDKKRCLDCAIGNALLKQTAI
jgi:hypothetical protein